MSTLTPREIVAELDKFVVGQEQAKRMVAVAVRNRWRRQHLPEELRDEVAPKNIIMMGPTGVGKTEIARRLAKLSGAPFIKVEATKFTEVGYVGRDVESMVRDLMEIGINLVREEENARVRAAAEAAAESRLLDLLLPNSFGGDRNDTREKLRQQFRLGFMDDREVEVEVTEQPAQGMDMFAIPGMEQMGNQVRDMFSKAFPPRRNRRKMKVREAYNVLIQEESGKLVDQEALANALAEQKIMGAALDVFTTEPIPADSPFLKLDNVTLTTHIAGTTSEALTNSPYLLMEDVAKFLNGEEAHFIVNKEVLENEDFKAWLAKVRG